MPNDQLVVLNKDEDTLSIIDVETGHTDSVVETAFNPHEVAVWPEGDRVYVTCSQGGKLLVFDTDSWDRIETLEHEHFEFPHGLAVRASAGELWMVATRSSYVFVIDLGTNEIVETFPTHQDKSHMIALDADERYGYIANIGSDSVTVVDCDSRRIVADPPVGESPEGIAVHPTAGVLVSNQDEDYLTILDVEALKEVNRALLGETPIRVVISPDTEYALVPNRESHDVSVIDCAYELGGEVRPWEIARIPVGRWPGGTTFSPEGERAFVANNKTNDISVIDTASWNEVDRYDAGIHPDGIAYLSR